MMAASNSRFPFLCFATACSLCWLHSLLRRGAAQKRRALLVGISFKYCPSNELECEPLNGPHDDVKRFREFLISTHGYSSEDITVLRDDPDFSDLCQPTRANMLRELRRLVAGAALGDELMFLYSGHSDQRPSYDGLDEATSKDQVIITSDLQRIQNNELNYILIEGLPVDCTSRWTRPTTAATTFIYRGYYRSVNVAHIRIERRSRRALLVGISYESSEHTSRWEVLEGPHPDVERFRNLLLKTYGYSPEDITVLKDDPELPESSQPTRANIIRELRKLVFGAAPGDKFTFLYSGHSDQQEARNDLEEEDNMDEVIITSDLERIVDDELNDILVKGLPVGCSLVAILDTCHSGTLLDLPHYHCNDLYVPWVSKGQRRTKTFHNKIVRENALGFDDLTDSTFRYSMSFVSGMTSQWPKDAPSSSPLRVITEIDSISSTNQGSTSAETDRQEAHGRRRSSPKRHLSPERQFGTPVGLRCDGWCEADINPHATVVSVSACADPQCAWEGPEGSLTAVLCHFLEIHPNPSYRMLMSHVNSRVYENCRMLHDYTRAQKKKNLHFDGELHNFQSPQLSSLSKLNMDDILYL